MQTRKKHRGIIEKRRRDRINTSLSELRRLVPTACEKQNSAKLEKAEILQMTVDHLKMLHTKGYDAMAYDPSKFAMDYHNMGFHECITEVNRHLTAEGLDQNNPLRTRLVSYLQSVKVQREFASKQSAWYSTVPPPPNASQPYQPNPSLSPITGSHHLQRHPPPIPIPPPGALTLHHTSLNSSGSSLEMNSSNSLNSSNPLNSSSSLSNSHSHSLNSSYENSGNPGSCEPTPTSSTQSSSTPSSNITARPLTTLSSITDGYNYLHHNPHQHPSMDLYQHHSQHLHQQHPYEQTSSESSPQMKQPYRPWGAEVAY